MTDCDEVYKEYGGQSVSGAAWKGAFQGVTGMVGAGGFWQPVDDSALTNITNASKDLQAAWQASYDALEGQINDDQQKFYQEQLTMLQEIEAFNDELLQEQIGSNTLYITIIFAALIIIIIYLLIL